MSTSAWQEIQKCAQGYCWKDVGSSCGCLTIQLPDVWNLMRKQDFQTVLDAEQNRNFRWVMQTLSMDFHSHRTITGGRLTNAKAPSSFLTTLEMQFVQNRSLSTIIPSSRLLTDFLRLVLLRQYVTARIFPQSALWCSCPQLASFAS